MTEETIIFIVVMVLIGAGIAAFAIADYREYRRGQALADIEALYYRRRMREDGLKPWGDEGGEA